MKSTIYPKAIPLRDAFRVAILNYLGACNIFSMARKPVVG